jgi:RHS repeat-associated protein
VTLPRRSRGVRERKAQGWVLEHDYDLAGNKVEFSLTVNATVNVTTYAYDEANRLKTVVDPEENQSSYTYDKVGNRTSLSYPNGVVAEYTYDARNRLTDLHNRKGTTTISRHRYTHHPDGNRATLTDQDDRVTTYRYDKLNRLEFETQVAAGGATVYDHKFVYDDVGNLEKKWDLTTSPPTLLTELAYNAADQISSTGFDYDDRGNMLSEHRPETQNGDWTYEYDSQNRLTHAYDGTNNFYYGYDGDGHRVKQTVNQIVTEFVVDLNGGLSQVVADINSGGNLKALYVRGDDLLSQLQSSEWHWYSYDGHGSTIALTDDAGEQADFYEYDAWGNPLDTNEHPLNRFRYSGQEEDDTGLYYLRARYYGPRIARFASRDPVTGSPQDPRTLHLYSYCAADPVNRTDPAGLWSLVCTIVVIAIVVILIGLVLYARTWPSTHKFAAQMMVGSAQRLTQVETSALTMALEDKFWPQHWVYGMMTGQAPSEEWQRTNHMTRLREMIRSGQLEVYKYSGRWYSSKTPVGLHPAAAFYRIYIRDDIPGRTDRIDIAAVVFGEYMHDSASEFGAGLDEATLEQCLETWVTGLEEDDRWVKANRIGDPFYTNATTNNPTPFVRGLRHGDP